MEKENAVWIKIHAAAVITVQFPVMAAVEGNGPNAGPGHLTLARADRRSSLEECRGCLFPVFRKSRSCLDMHEGSAAAGVQRSAGRQRPSDYRLFWPAVQGICRNFVEHQPVRVLCCTGSADPNRVRRGPLCPLVAFRRSISEGSSRNGKRRQPIGLAAFFVVAGAGFEPATFRF